MADADQAKAVQALSRFAERRLAFYGKVDIFDLLKKPALLYALKGATNADAFVDEAFAAFESSSEEGALGEALQAVILALSGGLETGDISIERENALWIVEIKSQSNTESASARTETLRKLLLRREDQRRVQRVRRIPVEVAYGVIRGRPKDVWRPYSPRGNDPTNSALKGSRYRYIVGEMLWRWLTSRPGISAFVPDLGVLNYAIDQLREARRATRARLKRELQAVLKSHDLPDTAESVLLLSDRSQAGHLRRGRRKRSRPIN